MYNESLASTILESLEEQFPEVVHFKALRERLPEFSTVSDRDWLTALDALLELGFINGVPLRDGSDLADLANIAITETGQAESTRRRQRKQQQHVLPNPSEDRKFAELALEEARKSVPEDGRVHPLVGAVVVKDGQVLAKAHRGEFPQCHAEYIALEKKLPTASLSGATVYTTLEPCTERKHPKVPCAVRLTERKISRVVIGMVDPDDRISGRGQRALRKARVAIDMFPPDLMEQIEELNRDFIRDRESAAPATIVSPFEIIFDPTNPARRFWSIEPLKNEKGERSPGSVWEYRVEIRNNSSKTIKNVSVTREHFGQMPIRAVDLIFDKTKAGFCDLNPNQSELAVVFNWPIPTRQPGMLAGITALEYGPIKLTASAADTLPTTRVFEFDYQREPMLRDVTPSPEMESAAPTSPSLPLGKIHFVPDTYNFGWAGNDGRTDVRAAGTFTYDGSSTLKILDVFVDGMTPRGRMMAQIVTNSKPGPLVDEFELRPHSPIRLMLNLVSEPITAQRDKSMRVQLVLLDVYNRRHELDPVDFPWIGQRSAPISPSSPTTTWQALAEKFKSVVATPIPVWAEWIYTIETKEYQWWIRHSSEVAVRMCIELSKEGGKMLLKEPEFRSKFPDLAAISENADRWLLGIHKVAGIGKASRNGTSVNQDVVTHSESGEIRDLPGTSQVLCQIALNGFTE